MYKPIQDGIEKATRSVEYTEARPPRDLAGLVHCFWELKTVAPLTRDFNLHAVPDACVDIMFNEIDTDIAGVTALRTRYEVLNLGKKFHYVGIELLPGAWQGGRDKISHQYIDTPYTGTLPLIEVNGNMKGLKFAEKQHVLAEFVRQLAKQKIVAANP